MDGEIAVKMARLGDSLKLLRAGHAGDAELVANINAQFCVVDSLVEFYGAEESVQAYYNRLKFEYARLCESERLYYSVDRSVRIDKIARDVERIVDVQDFIRQAVADDAHAVDTIAAHMAGSEAYIAGALGEMENYKRKVRRRMRFWHYLGILTLAVGGIVVYRALTL